MSTATDNGRRMIVVAPPVPDTGVSLVKIIPVWIASAIINVCLIVAAFFVFTFLSRLNAEDPNLDAPPPSTEVAEETPPDKDLTNTDIGLDDTVQLNYNVDRIEEVSVPGKVDPTAAIGVPGGVDKPPENVPAPPGSGGGFGGIRDPNEAGSAMLSSVPGGQGGIGGVGLPFGGRSGATRVKMLAEGGGNARSEAAVASGLAWLAHHQANDGHWGLHDFNRYARTAPFPAGKIVPDNSSPGTNRRNDIAGTAFGLLPFLAAGITHKKADKAQQVDYSKVVKAGLDYLRFKQAKSGSDRGYFGGDMYAHGLATIAMCEAYGLTSDPVLKVSAQMAINYICAAQDVGGGWRYQPRTPGDTSVTGWQLMAIKSGQMSGLTVPRTVLYKVEKFLDSVETSKNSGGYGYTPGGGETYTMTSVGLLCRQYLGANPRNPGLLAGIKKLRMYPPGTTGSLYYEYYATQVMHHMGGDHWQFWNLGPGETGKGGIRDTLIAKQDQGTGRQTGNKGSWMGGDHVGGRLGGTSLSLLTLEVYYRHLPLYRRDMNVIKPENK